MEASGSVDIFIIVDEAPAFGTRVTITDNLVTGIDPSTIDVGSYSKTTFASCLERFQASEQPALRPNHEDLTEAQIVEIVDDALASESFDATVVVCTNGELTGLLSFTEVTFNLDF